MGAQLSTIAILQARMSSSRLPGKVMLQINDKPMIYWQIRRILQTPEIHKVIVATSTDPSDDILVKFLETENIELFRGELDDVHSRFLAIINRNPSIETFLRLTGDCPLTMPQLLSTMLHEFDNEKYDYYSNAVSPTYPDGLDVEIFTRDSFLAMSDTTLSTVEKEHVTLKYRDPKTNFKIGEKTHTEDLSDMRWTVDYEEDFNFVRQIFEYFKGDELKFSLTDVLYLLIHEPKMNTQLPGSLRNIELPNKGEDA